MDRLDFSQKLNHFSYSYHKNDDKIFSIDDEVKARIIISRLYYSLFQRLLVEVNTIRKSSGANQHDALSSILEKNAGKGSMYRKLYEHFKDLQSLRIWADYRIKEDIKKGFDFAVLLEKNNRFIKSKKLIP